MTDKDVIKALECCSKSVCRECPYNVKNATCIGKLQNNALDLIIQQKAEIKRLKTENKILSKNADTAFQDGLNEAQDLYREQVKHEAKAEAIKEFADRLKEQTHNYYPNC